MDFGKALFVNTKLAGWTNVYLDRLWQGQRQGGQHHVQGLQPGGHSPPGEPRDQMTFQA